MRLIELGANHQSFKTVRFNRTGLTLIVGKHRVTRTADLKKTYNGVGKSLIVALVNYCLGSNKNEQFALHLPSWQFSLTFEHAGLTHVVRRDADGGKILLDDEDIGLKKFKEKLVDLGIFALPEQRVPFLTERSLLSFFLRLKHSSYVGYNKPQSEWTDYQSVLYQSFLLGLDYSRVVEKHNQKKKLEEQLGLADRYKKDKELREFYLGEKIAEVELLELHARIAQLEGDLASFRVAENYAERQRFADGLHAQLASIANEIVIQENLIGDLDMALALRPDVSPGRLIELYREATLALPELVVKRLEDVESFHRRLQENRRSRLNQERATAEERLKTLRLQASKLRQSLDAELQFLNAHRALDEYAANNAKLAELRGKEQRIRDYLQLLSQYTEEAQRIRAQMAASTVETNQYLRSIRPHLEMLMDKFREYSQELYGTVPAGLTVKNNDGENQVRYDIDAHIQNDAADGINQGKLFCYDLLLLSLRQRHAVDFVFHDNRLFADMDKYQRLSLFRLASRVCSELGTQYIATINEDVLNSVQDIAGAEEYQRLFVEPVVLELTDASGGTGKLLGLQVDMKYDE